jgi:putative spermidine/putrescine transport system ATP-binding protein
LRAGTLVTLGGAVPLSAPTAQDGAGHDDIPAGGASAKPPSAVGPATPRRTGNGPAELFFRPEDAALAPLDRAHLRGTIAAALFLGERTRLTITGAAPDPLIIDVAGRVSLTAGTQVGLSVRADGLVALP